MLGSSGLFGALLVFPCGLCMWSRDSLRPLFSVLQEMIVDKVNGQPVPRYLIYDIIKFNVSSAVSPLACY